MFRIASHRNTRASIVIAPIALLIFLLPDFAGADDIPAEIDYLLETIGSSDCTFVRNGSRHDAEGAEGHLRMKYKRGKRYAPTTELFIERLASKSSFSKKLYYIECESEETMSSGEWLMHRLDEYRSGAIEGHRET